MPRHRTMVAAAISAPSGYVYAVLAGRRRAQDASCSEPEPGRVLLERDGGSGAMTTYTVEPLPTGMSRVTIAADVTVRGGVRGRVERWVATQLLRRAHRLELERLAAMIARPAGPDGWSLTVRRPPARVEARVPCAGHGRI